MAGSQLLKVFVYGTLKRGQPNYHLLADVENGVAKFISEGQTSRKYPLVVGEFGVKENFSLHCQICF